LKGDFAGALKNLNYAVRLAPEDAAARFRRGLVHFRNNELDKAVEDYGKAFELDPQHFEACFNRALTYAEKKDLQNALNEYRRVVQLMARPPEVYKQWCAGQGKKGLDRHVDTLEAELLKSKQDSMKRFQEGFKLHKQGDLAGAVAKYDQALALYPRFVPIYYNRALAHRKRGNLDRAIHDYTQALRLDPKYVPAYSNRAFAYYKKGDLAGAIADFEQVIKLEPDNADAKKNRDTLKKLQASGR